MPRSVICIIGIVVFFVFNSAFALNKQQIPLNKLIQVYVKASDSLRAAESHVEANKSAVSEAWSRLYPSLSLEGGYTHQSYSDLLSFIVPDGQGSFRSFPLEDSYSLDLVASLPLYMGGGIWQGLELKKIELRRSQLQLRQLRQESILRFIKLLVNYTALIKRQRVVRLSMTYQKKYIKVVRARLKRGSVRDYTLYQAEADLYAYRSQLSEVSGLIDELKKRILLVSGIKDAYVGEFEIESVKSIPTVDEVVSTAQKDRSDFQMKELDIDSVTNQKKISLAKDLPQISVFGKYGFSHNRLEDIFSTEAHSSAYGLSIKIPLFSGLSSLHKRRFYAGQVSSAELHKQSALMKIKGDALGIINKLKMYSEQKIHAQKWYQLADRALLSGSKDFKNGGMSSLQLIQLQKGRELALNRLIQVEANWQIAGLDLKFIKGVDLFNYFTNINENNNFIRSR